MLRLASSLVKILIASLATGFALQRFDITAEQVLLDLGVTPENVMIWLEQGFKWAMPNLVLGSMVIVPVWLVVYLFRPPRS